MAAHPQLPLAANRCLRAVMLLLPPRVKYITKPLSNKCHRIGNKKCTNTVTLYNVVILYLQISNPVCVCVLLALHMCIESDK